MSLEAIPNRGLKAPGTVYSRLKAFQGGGFYWDSESQQLIRSALGDFLPALEQVDEKGQRSGLFRAERRGREVLSQSRSVGKRSKIPAKQWEQLQQQVAVFQRKADLPDVTVNSREVIRHFKLPDFTRNPEMYRLAGPFWDRRFYVLWGCERTTESSLAPEVALAKLPLDQHYDRKKWLSLASALLLLLALICFGLPWAWHLARNIANRKHVAQTALAAVDATQKPSQAAAAQPAAKETAMQPTQALSTAAPPSSPAGPAGPSASSTAPAASAPASEPFAAQPDSPGKGGPTKPEATEEAKAPKASPPSPATTSPKPAAARFRIAKTSENQLPDGQMAITFGVQNSTAPGISLPADYWEIDGVRKPGATEFAARLGRGRHRLVTRVANEAGTPATVTADIDVEVRASATLRDSARAAR